MQINKTNFWDRDKYFRKVPISYVIQTYWKKLALLRSLQFQFNFGRYAIKKIWSLKLPMDSWWIQASGWKSISVPNIWRNFRIYFARQSATLKKCQIMFFVAIWICMRPLTYWNLNSSSKILVLHGLPRIMLICCGHNVKGYNFSKRFV